MNLYVVRHGEVPSNKEKIISGWNNETLTEKGIRQAKEIKEQLENIKFDYVYSSPVTRAKQTAEIIMPDMNIIYDPRLAERNPGKMIGKSRDEIDKNEWNSLTTLTTKDEVETLLSGLNRTRCFFKDLEAYNDRTLLIITHNFNSKCIWMIANGIQDEDEINSFFHKNDEIKHYTLKQIPKINY